MTEENTSELNISELDTLKRRADMLGIQYHPAIGVAKLKAKVNAAIKPAEPAPAASMKETKQEMRSRLRREAGKLVRVRITCMNPDKKEWAGEIFTASNSVVGTYKKFVPFNNDEGWHVPQIILNQIKERQCQVFVTKKDSRGNSTKQGKLIKEFAIEIMEPLTGEEIATLAANQAAGHNID